MKITYIYRKPGYIQRKPGDRTGSIENVFNTIEKEIKDKYIYTEKIYHTGTLFNTIKRIKATDADIYHVTGDVHYLALFLPRKKTILTVHDIGHFDNHKKTIRAYIYLLIWFILPLFFLKKITVISKHTKDKLQKILPFTKGKLTIIPNPLSIHIDELPKVKHNMPVIMQIGSGWQKNLNNLIEAAKNIKCKLHIVGKPNEGIEKKLINLNINYEFFENVTDRELEKLYNNSDMLFFASFSEGFGLPIIEAQTAGVPVITSNESPMNSVSGGAAVLVNPHSVEEIKGAIIKLIPESEYKSNLIKEGKVNANQYSVNKIAKLYLRFYKE